MECEWTFLSSLRGVVCWLVFGDAVCFLFSVPLFHLHSSNCALGHFAHMQIAPTERLRRWFFYECSTEIGDLLPRGDVRSISDLNGEGGSTLVYHTISPSRKKQGGNGRTMLSTFRREWEKKERSSPHDLIPTPADSPFDGSLVVVRFGRCCLLLAFRWVFSRLFVRSCCGFDLLPAK
jgi:hypothetical protein